jgi:hypothetical protein
MKSKGWYSKGIFGQVEKKGKMGLARLYVPWDFQK